MSVQRSFQSIFASIKIINFWRNIFVLRWLPIETAKRVMAQKRWRPAFVPHRKRNSKHFNWSSARQKCPRGGDHVSPSGPTNQLVARQMANNEQIPLRKMQRKESQSNKVYHAKDHDCLVWVTSRNIRFMSQIHVRTKLMKNEANF